MSLLEPKHDASVALVRREDEVLLVRRRDIPIWVLPGGGIDPGESAEEAAIREVMEESGYTIEVVRKVAEYTPHHRFTRLTHFFEGRPLSGEATLSDESDAVQWWPLDELPRDLLFAHRRWIEEALEEREELIRRPLTEVNPWSVLCIFFRYPGTALSYFVRRLLGRA